MCSAPGVLCHGCRCAAALDALDKALGLSNLQASDSYLCAMLAAAEGNLVLPDQQQQQQQHQIQVAQPGAAKDPTTPRDVQAANRR